MTKSLLEDLGDGVFDFGKDIGKKVIKTGETIAGIESQDEDKSVIVDKIKKILPESPLE